MFMDLHPGRQVSELFYQRNKSDREIMPQTGVRITNRKKN